MSYGDPRWWPSASAGYTCAWCGAWISWGMLHWCSGAYYYRPVYLPIVPDEDCIKRLEERIAELERRDEPEIDHWEDPVL